LHFVDCCHCPRFADRNREPSTPPGGQARTFWVTDAYGGYASVGCRLGFARFAISQSKFPRANCLFRTSRKEKSTIRLLPAHDTGMNGGMNGPACWGQSCDQVPHPRSAALQDFGPDIDGAAIDHSECARQHSCARNAREWRVLARGEFFNIAG
jgi:hypothetical protein